MSAAGLPHILREYTVDATGQPTGHRTYHGVYASRESALARAAAITHTTPETARPGRRFDVSLIGAA